MTLASLTASNGIDFEDEKSHFAGSVLFYDGDKDLLTVRGDAVQPCMFNGAPVDQIVMNLKTGTSTPLPPRWVLQIQHTPSCTLPNSMAPLRPIGSASGDGPVCLGVPACYGLLCRFQDIWPRPDVLCSQILLRGGRRAGCR
jgi:hypothetical protein